MKHDPLNKTIIVIVTDSITNSVFESQLLIPLQKRMLHEQIHQAIIISFERKTINAELIQTIESQAPSIKLIVKKTIPFLGTWSLYPAILFVKKLLTDINEYQILARGPLAGYIASRAAPFNVPLTIQARGLLAEEYDYTHKKTSPLLKRLAHIIRKKLFFNLERTVYGSSNYHTIEVVSDALADYLVDVYKTDLTKITFAQYDMPDLISPQIKTEARPKIRHALNIPQQAYVICYSGSLKPWQCFDQTVSYLEKQIRQNPLTVLLVLTPDLEKAQQILSISGICSDHYRVCSIKPKQLVEYLAAADAGILYREKHIVNWVSRPTKALEYQAAMLPIIHNNTIQSLIRSKDSKHI
jgi:hypothetical protein